MNVDRPLLLRCSRCQKELSPNAFSPRPDRPRGYSSACRTCLNQPPAKTAAQRISQRAPQPADWQSADGRFFLLDTELQAYLNVINGSTDRLPHGFWTDNNGLDRGLACLRYGVTVLLNAHSRTEIRALSCADAIVRLHLRGLLHFLTVYECFRQAFPEYNLLAWEMRFQVPREFWERGGEEAAREAFQWWLDQEQLSPQQALVLHHRRELNIHQRLQTVGLHELLKFYSAQQLFSLVDPTIPAERPMSRSAQRRRESILICPWCGARRRSLSIHAVKGHGATAAEMRATLNGQAAEIPTLQQRRQQLSRRPRSRFHSAGRTILAGMAAWGRDGLSFPATWWPGVDRFYRSVVEGQALLVLPAAPDGRNKRQLRRRGSRLCWRPPARLRAQLEPCPVFRSGDGIRIDVADPGVLALCQRWSLRPGRWVSMPDLRITPAREAMYLRADLWPATARYVAIRLDAIGRLVLRPRAATGDEASHRVRRQQRPPRRWIMSAAKFLQSNNVAGGGWRLVERAADGSLVFVADSAK